MVSPSADAWTAKLRTENRCLPELFHDPDALLVMNGQCFADAPGLSSDPTLHSDRSPLNEVLEPVSAEDVRKPLRIQNSINAHRHPSMSGDFGSGNELEHTD